MLELTRPSSGPSTEATRPAKPGVQSGPTGPGEPMRRKLPYLILMGTCVLLFVLSWTVVRRYSAPAAVAMTIVALAIPPLAAIVANAGRESGGPDRRNGEPPSR
jgi:Protein of unknown function (DUF3099)